MALAKVDWHSTRRLTGYPLMSAGMMNVLIDLHNAKEAGQEFIELTGIHKRVLNSLFERDWIFPSHGVDGSLKYKLTGRGEKAIRAYSHPPKRTDDICPRCNLRPKGFYKKSGRKRPYCTVCLSNLSKRKLRLGIENVNSERLCSRCKKRPLHRYRGGRYCTYCLHCKNINGRREHRKKRRQLLKRIQAGEFIKCRKKDCPNPVHVYGKTVNDYCKEHWQVYINAYNDRRRPDNPVTKRRQQTTLGVA